MASLKSPGLISLSISAPNTRKETIDNKIAILKANEPKPESFIVNYKNEVKCAVITSDDKYIIAGQSSGDITITIIDGTEENNENDINLVGHKDEIKCFCLTCDDKYLISGSYDWTIRI